MQRNEKKVDAHALLFKLTVDANELFNARHKIRYLTTYMASQIDDYALLIKEKYAKDKDVSLMYRKYLSQKFYNSEWGNYLTQFTRYKEKLVQNIDALNALQKSYKKAFQSVSEDNILNDPIYIKLVAEVNESRNLYVRLTDLDFEVLMKKANPIIELATGSLETDGKIPSPKSKQLTLSAKAIHARVIGRDINLFSREMIATVKNVQQYLLVDMEGYSLAQNDVAKITAELKAYSELIQAADEFSACQVIINELDNWKCKNHHINGQYLARNQHLYNAIKQSSSVVRDYFTLLGRLENTLAAQLEDFKNEHPKRNDDSFKFLLNRIKNMITGLRNADKDYLLNHFDEDYAVIANIYHTNQFQAKSLFALGTYLEQINKLRVYEVDFTLLNDLKHFHYLACKLNQNTTASMAKETFTEPKFAKILKVASAVSEVERAKISALHELKPLLEQSKIITSPRSHLISKKNLSGLKLDLRETEKVMEENAQREDRSMMRRKH